MEHLHHSKKIRVLMIGPNLRVSNGVASVEMNYFRNINAEQVEFDFATLEYRETPYIEEIEKRGGHVYVLPPVKDAKKHLQACKKIIQEGKYDVVHDNTLFKSFPLMWCAKKAGVPVRALHSHAAAMGETRKKKVINTALLPILKSQCNVNLACSELAGKCMFGNKPFVVIPNAIDMKRFCLNKEVREQVRSAMGSSDKVIVGTIGRLALQKNPFFAMDVFAEFLKIQPNAEYWWIGTGAEDEKVKQYAESKNLQGSVRFLGNRTDTAELYQGMDVFFMPSLFEGLPVTGIEAQATDLPCVFSDTITKELQYSNLVHYLSLDENAEKWAQTLQNVVQEREQQEVKKDSARFDITACAEKLVNVYQKCIASKAR